MGNRPFKTLSRGNVILVAALFCELVVRIDIVIEDLTCARIQVEHTLHPEHARAHYWIEGTCEPPQLEGSDLFRQSCRFIL